MGGEQTDAEFRQFLTDFLGLSGKQLIQGGVAYAFINWRHVHDMIIAGKTAGLHLVNMAVWTKQPGMGAFYRSAHEMCAVFCNGPTPAINNIKLGAKGRDRANVWAYPSANQKGSSANAMLAHHPTPKCVEMIVDMLLDVSKPGDIVLDPFIGSGTTIIAAQECGRAARGIELDPKYVDLAVRRWEAITGEAATLALTGETFAAVQAARVAEAAAATAAQ